MLKNSFYYIFFLVLNLLPYSLLAENQSASNVISAPNISVQLISEFDGLIPGQDQLLALRMKPDQYWHVYWKYHGDTGTPPKIKFDESDGLEFGEILWPFPEKIQISHLINYGYGEEVLLLIPVKVSKDLQGVENVSINAEASWLVCQEECIPGSANLNMILPVNETAKVSQWAEKFHQTKYKLPLKDLKLEVEAFSKGQDQILLKIKSGQGLEVIKNEVLFIPDSAKQIENVAEQNIAIENKDLLINLKKSKSDAFPEKISGLLISETGWNENRPQALEISAELQEFSEQESGSVTFRTILTAIIFAFTGGLILNLMPCVFPIISIKILGFVKKSGKEKKKIFRHGLLFGLGVLFSFWFLAGSLIALQSAGYKLGWGFQLQSPLFLLSMIVLLFLIGLNLFGYFEFGSRLQNIAGRYNSSGYFDSFLSGVLATLLATPCTAPFMGTAIAVSLASSNTVAFLIFTFLAIGMALPYVVLSGSPSLLKFVPKPGAWMEKFKQFLSFPIFLTVIWLCGVYLKQAGMEYTNKLLFFLLLIFISIWVLKNIKKFSKIIAALLLLLAVYLVLPKSASISELKWQPFSNKTLDEYVSKQSPVFIDFTAEWCLTCKLNKFVALDTAAVVDKFREKNVVMLKADWTSVDPEISDAIKSYGRSGVPLNVLYYGGVNKEPYIFPAVLTPNIVLKELNKIK